MNSSAIPVYAVEATVDDVDSRREAVRYHVQLAHELEETDQPVLPLALPVGVLEDGGHR